LKQRNALDVKDRHRDNRDNIKDKDKDKDRVVIPPKPINKFSALLEEEEQAEAVEKAIEIATNGIAVKRNMDFPESLSKKTSCANVISNNNWALMASNASALAVPKAIPVKPVVINNVDLLKSLWADDSDDEDLEEDEDEPQLPPQQQYVANYNVYEDEW
jgi:hypothetical protein